MAILPGKIVKMTLPNPLLILVFVFSALNSYSQETPIKGPNSFNWRDYVRNAHLLNPLTLQQTRYRFSVLMKDGSEVFAESKIFSDTALRKNYIVYTEQSDAKSKKKNTRRIYCDETVSISRQDLYEENTMTGMATDSCWQFRILSGHISAYSVLSERQRVDSRNISAMRIGNGPIEAFDADKLETIIKDNEKAYKVFQRQNYYRAIQLYNETNTH